jgi:hypothetical protein
MNSDERVARPVYIDARARRRRNVAQPAERFPVTDVCNVKMRHVAHCTQNSIRPIGKARRDCDARLSAER